MEIEALNILQNMVSSTIQQVVNSYQPKEWLSLKEGASYAGVSYNTFLKFREMGLKVTEIDGIKRVSKSTIDSFYDQHSF
ncbi:DNA-binding protein [Lysinibacillus sp. CNPSo 3705]|uniref:DNA-binding protein n=1 Tax=Lysinibacillus sp. CNPSo 3705 TaxID=3028148 RepID=UPI002363CD67|nr:DNA-binding protein [Lysinibacillus sp. CNPSo 3705]MDD1505418.1 DNA-binding protein [Lysinibacillus sp. CNPSo 3705]